MNETFHLCVMSPQLLWAWGPGLAWAWAPRLSPGHGMWVRSPQRAAASRLSCHRGFQQESWGHTLVHGGREQS